MTAISNAVARTGADDQRFQAARDMVRTYALSFERVLPSQIRRDQFVALAIAQLQRSPELREAATISPDSYIHALMDCATKGHLPGEGYALTVRKLKGRTTVLGIEEYTGMIQRIYQAGAVKSIKAEVVRENDLFDKDTEPPTHKPAWYATDPPGQIRNGWMASDETRGPIVGAYAYAVMDSGALSRVVVMNRDKILKHRAKAAQHYIWDEWDEEQTLKTVLRQLRKFVPTSSEYLQQRAAAEVERAQVAEKIGAAPVDYTHDDAPALAVEAEDWPDVAEPGGA